MTTTLITIPFSHYCEKARWALDWCGVAYRERAYLPGAHRRATARAGGRTVPVVVREDGPPLTDSTDILRWADAQAPAPRRLFPDDPGARAEAERLEDDFDERLGPATRQWAYAHGLRNRPMLRKMVAPSFPRRRDRLALGLLMPVVGPLIARQYDATLENAGHAEETILAVFADVSARLKQDRYLGGARFGAADLTFAALGGPMVMPKEHPTLASDVELTPSMRAFVDRLRATHAGAHAARMYRDHRRAS